MERDIYEKYLIGTTSKLQWMNMEKKEEKKGNCD